MRDGLLKRTIRWLYWRSESNHGDPVHSDAIEHAYENGLAEAGRVASAELDDAPTASDMQVLYESIHTLSRSYIFQGTDQEAPKRLLEALSVMYQITGYVDGMACLSGISLEYRHTLKHTADIQGKDRCLKAHDAVCTGCKVGEVLRDELNPKQAALPDDSN